MPITSTIAKLAENVTVTIPASTTTSDALDLYGYTLCGFYVPSGMEGATIGFLTAPQSEASYAPMKDGAGSALSKTIAAGDYIYLDPAVFVGVRFLKLVASVTQSANRVITIAARPV